MDVVFIWVWTALIVLGVFALIYATLTIWWWKPTKPPARTGQIRVVITDWNERVTVEGSNNDALADEVLKELLRLRVVTEERVREGYA